jgi:PhzF family phenazine biosynthesis protein
MSIPLFQVDAFTDRPFRGNPAAVCLLESPAEDHWMQDVAAEMNLAETAFVWPEDGGFRLRWFTPRIEVDLCGHATLAAAHVLWETGRLAESESARFNTRSGCLSAARTDRGITLDFPATPPRPIRTHTSLLGALGIAPKAVRYVGRSDFDVLVEVADEETVRVLAPDYRTLGEVPARGIIVTSRADSSSDADIVSRFFAPAVGIDEDPVTGSAHCCLGPHWAARTGRSEFNALQASRREGRIHVVVRGDRVELTGEAVTVLRGELVPYPNPIVGTR